MGGFEQTVTLNKLLAGIRIRVAAVCQRSEGSTGDCRTKFGLQSVGGQHAVESTAG